MFCLSGGLPARGLRRNHFYVSEHGKRSARLDTRLMLHELHSKVNDLFHQVRRLDAELQELQGIVFTFVKKEEQTGEPDRRVEIHRLYKEGLSPDEIARRLKLGKGEVEFVLSLNNKPSWVIGAK